MNTKEIGHAAHEINRANGWDVFTPFDFPTNQLDGDKDRVRFACTHMALVHTEVSEATEAIRRCLQRVVR